MNTENFEALWADFKGRVASAHGHRQAIYTFGETVMTQRYGGRLSIGDIEEFDEVDYVHLSVGRDSWSGMISLNKQDLLNIAAQLIAAAEEIETKANKYRTPQRA